ncbi:MAG: DUF2442 domain-containing protein [Planctomycetota bacterium]
MCEVARVEALPGFRLHVEYTDGLEGTVDISDWLWGPVFEPLKDPEFFAKVAVDEYGAVCWPNGADLAPDGHLRTRLEEQAARAD